VCREVKLLKKEFEDKLIIKDKVMDKWKSKCVDAKVTLITRIPPSSP